MDRKRRTTDPLAFKDADQQPPAALRLMAHRWALEVHVPGARSLSWWLCALLLLSPLHGEESGYRGQLAVPHSVSSVLHRVWHIISASHSVAVAVSK